MPTTSPVAMLTIGEPDVPWMVPQPGAYLIESCHVQRSSRRVGTNVWMSQLKTRAKKPDGTNVSPAAGWLAAMVRAAMPVLDWIEAKVRVSRYSVTSVPVIVAYSTRSAASVATPVPAALRSVPRRVLLRLMMTWPAARNPPSKQWPLVSIMARSLERDVGNRTREAEQL